MALQVLPEVPLGGGIPGVPDWLFDIIPAGLSTLQEVFHRIATGIITSYYHTGRAIVRRAISVEMQRLLSDLRDGFETTFEALGQGDPVEAIIDQVRAAHSTMIARERRLIEQGTPLLPNLGGQIVDTVAGAAQTVSNIVVDVTNIPMDGYNALQDGVHRLGQWVQMAGSDGGTPHYSYPPWVLYVLQELETPGPNISAASRQPRTLKRKSQDGLSNPRQKKARTRKSTQSGRTKTTKNIKKGRRGGLRHSATK
ncbi:VP2 protein [Calomys tener polyomavirus]|nr:VP2 protein [Akodon montensis polyomavirus]AVY05545.1 VP2 protein [Akodon montensis polyomavirus]AVY05550.1 VP2 protein [Calomys tener polyomavirus]